MPIGRSRIGVMFSGPVSRADTSGLYRKTLGSGVDLMTCFSIIYYRLQTLPIAIMLDTGVLFRARESDPCRSSPRTHVNSTFFKGLLEEVMIPYYRSLSGHNIF